MRIHQTIKRRLPIKRLQKNEDGVYAIEFAIVIIPTLVLIFGIIELGLLFIANNLLDLGTQKASRLVRTGNAATVAEFKAQIDKTAGILLDTSKITIDVTSYDDFDDFNKNRKKGGQNPDGSFPENYDPGEGESIMLVRVFYIHKGYVSGIIPSNSATGKGHLLNSSFVFRNEPYNSDAKTSGGGKK